MNDDHLSVLRQGVDVRNSWRLRNRSVQPDLSKANLKGMDLNRSNLTLRVFIGKDLKCYVKHAIDDL